MHARQISPPQTGLFCSHGDTVSPFRHALLFCRVYVDAEEKQLRETMESLVREESWQPMEDAQQTNVLKSSSELFAVIKRSLTRCSKFVSTGAAMLQLCNAFQVSWLYLPMSCFLQPGAMPGCPVRSAAASQHACLLHKLLTRVLQPCNVVYITCYVI